MNKWVGFSLGALAAIVAFILGQIMHPFSDFNPVGFHAKGQVQINGTSTFNASNCLPTGKTQCTLTFDFALDKNNTPTALLCNGSPNCLSFSTVQGNPMQASASSSSPTSSTWYPDYVTGRVVVGP
ncbi:MAG TPA: hypothetical protein VHT92_00495 [Candidatus Cybelea sp.]|jgi:hypothetical protein|nr:hypothetical protein [Candidatus Cybelea sp.]